MRRRSGINDGARARAGLITFEREFLALYPRAAVYGADRHLADLEAGRAVQVPGWQIDDFVAIPGDDLYTEFRITADDQVLRVVEPASARALVPPHNHDGGDPA